MFDSPGIRWWRSRLLPFFVCVLVLLVVNVSSASAQSGKAGAESFRIAQYFYPYERRQRYRGWRDYRQPRYRPRRVRKPKSRVRKSRPRKTARSCRRPWSYSRRLGRCVCTRSGYGLRRNRCVKLAAACPTNAVWSRKARRCVCKTGYVDRNKECVAARQAVAAVSAGAAARCLWPRVEADGGTGCTCAAGYDERGGQCVRNAGTMTDVAGPQSDAETDLVARVQRCLKRTGFLDGPLRERITDEVWTAFWKFKRKHAIGATPDGIDDKAFQSKLFALCDEGDTRVAALSPATAAAPGARASSAASSAPRPRVYARPEAGCLPKDLFELIVRTYGPRPDLRRCRQTCLAIPKTLGARVVAEYEQKRDIAWCRSCLELNSHLPLDDILRIERGTNVQICTRPPTQLPRWVHPARLSRQAYTKVREIYRSLPPAADHARDIAVVIGNRSYRGDLPANETAHNNAGAMYALLTEHLGYRFENIVDLRDASLRDFNRVFGSATSHEGELSRRLKGRPEASVLIYYAGHGRASADQSDGYLLPVDVVKHREARTAYPISRLYANLGRLGARSVLVLLETGFGRDLDDFVFPPNIPEMWVRSLPSKPLPGLTVMTAADRDQKTLDDPRYGIGLFTRYLIEAMAGRADLAPIGNGDGKIDVVELYAYSAHMVRLAARKSFGLLQRPSLSRLGNITVSRVESQPR